MDSDDMTSVESDTSHHLGKRQMFSPDNDHDHTWVVFSTAVADGWLMLQCVDCGFHGVVKDPTKKEWSKAFRAPSRPYIWSDESRVVCQPQVAREKQYVVRTDNTSKCECYEQRGLLEPRGFERFPNELTRPSIKLSLDDREELASLAETVRNGRLCSFLLEHFLECCQQETGFLPGSAVKEVARRVSQADRMGLHCSPAVVARLLEAVAAS